MESSETVSALGRYAAVDSARLLRSAEAKPASLMIDPSLRDRISADSTFGRSVRLRRIESTELVVEASFSVFTIMKEVERVECGSVAAPKRGPSLPNNSREGATSKLKLK